MSALNKPPDGQAPPVTIEAVMVEVNKALDAKLTSRFDDFKKTGLGDAIKLQIDPLSSQLGTINEALGKLVAGGAGGGAAGGAGGGENKGQLPPEVNEQIRNMTQKLTQYGTEIQTLKTGKEQAEKRAEETERHSTIRTAINGLPFVNDKAAETAFSIVLPTVRRLDGGELVAGLNGDAYPVPSFAKEYLEKEHGYLFKSSGASGSGAPPNGGSVRVGAKADINSIKVGMKAEDRANAVADIAAALASA